MSGTDISLQTIRNSHGSEPVVIIMGMTGAGKSSFVQKLVDDDQASAIQIGNQIVSCTQSSKLYDVQIDTVRVQVVDTPGLSDTFRTDEEIMKDIVKFYVALHQLGYRLKGFIYLIDITGKVTSHELKHLLMLQKLCGDHACRNIVFATTKWRENWTDKDLQDRWASQILLHGVQFLGNFIRDGAAVHRYDGTSTSAKNLLRSLVGKDYVEFQIVREIKRGTATSLYDTNVGQFLYSTMKDGDGDAAGQNNPTIVSKESSSSRASLRQTIQDAEAFVEAMKNEIVQEELGPNGIRKKEWTKQELRELAKKILGRVVNSSLQIFSFVANVMSMSSS